MKIWLVKVIRCMMLHSCPKGYRSDIVQSLRNTDALSFYSFCPRDLWTTNIRSNIRLKSISFLVHLSNRKISPNINITSKSFKLIMNYEMNFEVAKIWYMDKLLWLISSNLIITINKTFSFSFQNVCQHGENKWWIKDARQLLGDLYNMTNIRLYKW